MSSDQRAVFDAELERSASESGERAALSKSDELFEMHRKKQEEYERNQ